jgi:hypothetical protein
MLVSLGTKLAQQTLERDIHSELLEMWEKSHPQKGAMPEFDS